MLDFLNQPYKNILFMYQSKKLGDFINYCFYLAFYYKKYYNSHITVIGNVEKIGFFLIILKIYLAIHILTITQIKQYQILYVSKIQ